MTRTVLLLALLSSLCLAACGGAAPPPPVPDAASAAPTAPAALAAPAFSLAGVDGQMHTLAQYAGRVVVLEWTNYDCPFVKKHYDSQNMQHLQKKYAAGETGAIWLSINSSAPGKQGNFSPAEWKTRAEAWGAAPTAILLDPTGATGKAYGATNTPHMFVIDPAGVIVYRGAIDSVSTPDPADIPGAENYVAGVLDHLLAGHAVAPRTTRAYGCGVKYAE